MSHLLETFPFNCSFSDFGKCPKFRHKSNEKVASLCFLPFLLSNAVICRHNQDLKVGVWNLVFEANNGAVNCWRWDQAILKSRLTRMRTSLFVDCIFFLCLSSDLFFLVILRPPTTKLTLSFQAEEIARTMCKLQKNENVQHIVDDYSKMCSECLLFYFESFCGFEFVLFCICISQIFHQPANPIIQKCWQMPER